MSDRGGLGELWSPFLDDPARAAVLSDFDGTLAPIVDDPAAARPLPGAVDALAALAERYAIVAVVSGRPASFLTAILGNAAGRVLVSALYGLETARLGADGTWDLSTHPDAAEWVAVVEAERAQAAASAPAGLLVEAKGLSFTIHWRTAPEHARWAAEWADVVAERSGLAAHPAKASVELRPPIARDKGTVVQELGAALGAVCFLGDDVGDMPAVAALRALPATTVAVAVGTTETPQELRAAADVVVDGPEGALELLRALGR
jgi:trehalose 6-phosphate phosphatase